MLRPQNITGGFMKVVVYTICKNEAQFVERWVESMSEADSIVVLDTGSTDDTVEKLEARGVTVIQNTISPWRFDIARNLSLSFVPNDADICVCTDLDEIFVKGWRKKLEDAWTPGTGRASYRYTWNFLEDGSEGVVFWADKIHSRNGWCWTEPVHEVLKWIGEGAPKPTVVVEGMQLNHYADPSKSRGQYLSLLELAVREHPENDRSMHYLGREYLFYGRWQDCIDTLLKHLSMPTAKWADERAASMRFIARSFKMLGDEGAARNWYLQAIAQAPYLREAYVELARLLYEQGQWDGVLYFTGCALAISERPKTYICDAEAWGSLPHDLRAIAFARTNRIPEALSETQLALSYSPNDKRLIENLHFLQNALRPLS